jgi:hypothetical protein
MADSMGTRQTAYEQRAAIWTKAMELVSDRTFPNGESRTLAEVSLARFLAGE